MKKLSLILLSFLFIVAIQAQKNFWSSHTSVNKIVTDKAVGRLSFPKEFKLFDLNIEPLRQELFSVVDNNASRHSTIISLPNADGGIEQFEVFEASNFEPDLQADFPEIRAFSGKGVTDKYAILKLSISPQGIQTMVFRTDKENEFIEAYSQDHSVYAVFKSQRKPGQLPWVCSTDDKKSFAEIGSKINNTSSASGSSTGQLKTLRLAQSCNGEYANYFGATSATQVGLVLAAFNATLTRCNGCYEKDLAVHLNLIAATTAVIYYNPSTDPYTTLANWNQQEQTVMTNNIGSANYDIGHMFGASGGGGNAGCIGCVCVNPTGSVPLGKGSGITSPADGIPQGDNFDVDYVVHEVGHQLGANHTFTNSNEGTGVQKEIGSGITIMGYAGITSQDVAPHSIDIYHEASIAQIQANLATKTCPVTTDISANNVPPVVAAVSNYTIPKSTPFALTGSASDANGDALTYCWEQNDDGGSQTGANSKASVTKTSGPNWLTFSPTASPVRTCPILSTILAGGVTTGPLPGGDAGINIEALSSVARTLNFRLTVRDNAAYSSTAPVKVGQTAFTDMVVTVSAASGPFAVTSPNTAVSYVGGSSQAITWAVASTTASPVSCANVKISLSTDGGQTFPTVLAASTPNDGTETLTIPNTPTTTARIKVEAVGNIFFDISNANFTITSGSSCGSPSGLNASGITTSSATVNWTAVSGALSYDVDYKLTTTGTWTNAATATTSTSVNITGLSASTVYDWRVRTNCSGSSSAYTAAQFTTAAAPVCNAPSGLNATSVTTSGATLNWGAVSGAVSYDVDYKLTTTSTWTNAATGTSSTSVAISGLSSSTVYDWQVRTNCSFGSSGYTASQFTTAAVVICNAPTGLSSTVTSSDATVSWTAVSGAVSYDVDYKLTTTGTWTNAATGTSSTSVTITGLSASTVYDWQVRTNCSGGSSGYSAAQFTTSAASTCSTAFEPNETQATAAAISSGVTNSAAISSSTDIDYYKITTTATSNIVYNLVGPSGVDYDLYIYNSSGTQVGASEGNTSTETVSLTSQAAGTYSIKVVGYNGANSASCYTIKATATTATGCQSSYDVSTNGTTSGAATIPFNTNITGLISPTGDIDDYKFVITTGGTITVTLGTLPSDYDLKLLNSSGSQVAISQNSSTTGETINYTAAAGTYYAQAYGYNGNNSATTCYTLKVQLGTAGKQTESLPFVANKNSISVYPNPVSNLLNIGLPGEVTANSSFVMLDAKGTVVMQQKFVKNPQQVDVSKLTNGIYLIKINNGGKLSTEKFVKE